MTIHIRARADIDDMYEIRMKPRWWLPVYLNALALVVWITQCEPNAETVGNFILHRGFKVFMVEKEEHLQCSNAET